MIDKSFPFAAQLFQNGLNVTESFYQILTKEANYLKENNNIDTFNELIAQKNQLIPQLDEFSKQLEKVLKTESLTINREGIQQYFIIAKTAGLDISTAENNWEKLADLSEKCQHLNEQNGASIALLARHTKRTLDILKGKPKFANTYGSNGISSYESSSNPIASA